MLQYSTLTQERHSCQCPLILEVYLTELRPGSVISPIKPGMSKVRPGGQSRPAVRFHTARSFGLIMYYLWPACTVKQNK